MLKLNFLRFAAFNFLPLLFTLFHVQTISAQHPCDNFPVTVCVVPSSLETWTIVDNNSAATGQTGEQNYWSPSSPKSLWYAWTAPQTRVYVADMKGTNPNNTTVFDAFLSVHTGGNTFATLTERWNADSWLFPCTFYLSTIRGTESNDSPCIFIYATAGTKYNFSVDSYGGTAYGIQGAFNLNLRPFIEPTSANVSISGRVLDVSGNPISKISVKLIKPNGEVLKAITNSFGFYVFSGIESGQTYILQANSKHFTFQNNPRVLFINEDLTGQNLTGTENPN